MLIASRQPWPDSLTQKIPQRPRHHLPKLCSPALFLSCRPVATCPLLPFRCPSIRPSRGMDMAVVATHRAGGQILGGFVRTLPETPPSWTELYALPSPSCHWPFHPGGGARVWTEMVCSRKSLVRLALANHRVCTAGGGADRQKHICIMSVGRGRVIHVRSWRAHFQLFCLWLAVIHCWPTPWKDSPIPGPNYYDRLRTARVD